MAKKTWIEKLNTLGYLPKVVKLNPKYPGGIKEQTTNLISEGHTIVKKGNRFFVKDFEKNL